MTVVFNNVFVLFVFAVVGYILSRTGVADSKHAKLLSCFLVYFFFPCKVFKTFIENFTVEYLSEKYIYVVVSFVVLIFVITAAFLISGRMSEQKYEKKLFCYSFIVPNFGYMGYALIESLFGSRILLNTILFGLPITMFTYTAGYCMLTNTKITPKRLVQPITVALGLGIIFGLCGIKIPQVFLDVFEKAGNCTGPVSMLLLGLVISEFKFKELLCDLRVYFVSFMRLIVLPCLAALVLRHYFDSEMVLAALGVYAMPCGLNSVVFPRLIGEDCRIGAGVACVSTIAACITIPIVFSIFI